MYKCSLHNSHQFRGNFYSITCLAQRDDAHKIEWNCTVREKDKTTERERKRERKPLLYKRGPNFLVNRDDHVHYSFVALRTHNFVQCCCYMLNRAYYAATQYAKRRHRKCTELGAQNGVCEKTRLIKVGATTTQKTHRMLRLKQDEA